MFGFFKNRARNIKNSTAMVMVIVSFKDEKHRYNSDGDLFGRDPCDDVIHEFRLNGRAIIELGQSFDDRVNEAIENGSIGRADISLYRNNRWLFAVEAMISRLKSIGFKEKSPEDWGRFTFWSCGVISNIYKEFDDKDTVSIDIHTDGWVVSSRMKNGRGVRDLLNFQNDIIGNWLTLSAARRI